jgi:hypothetical protein
MPDSCASAGILSARNKNGSLRRSGRIFAWASPLFTGPGLQLVNCESVQLEVLADTEGLVLRRPFQLQVDAVEQGLGAELGGW